MDEKEVEAFVEEEEVIYSKHIAMHEKADGKSSLAFQDHKEL